MIINHNISVLNSFRIMNNNSLQSQEAMEKLSSGLRINSASDDAAGLAISEKMRAQVRGLDQASRNSQDAISMIQTAEGALGETHSLLQRMRELATQAANDTNVNVDRDEIQKEINQLTSEVNRIGNTTEFNTRKLLNIDSVDVGEVNSVIDGIMNKGWLEVPENLIFDAFGLKGNGANLKVDFINDSSINFSAYVTGTTATTDQTLTVNLAYFTPSSGDSGDNNSGKANYSDRVLAHEMVHAVMNSAFGVANTIAMPNWFKEGASEFIHGGDERLKSHIADGMGGIDSPKLDALITRATDLLNGAAWNSDSFDYAAGYLIVKYIDDVSGNSTKAIMQDIESFITNDGDTGNIALEKAIVNQTAFGTFADFKADFTNVNVTNFVSGLELNFAGDELDTGSVVGSDHGGGSNLNGDDIIDNSQATGALLQHFQVELPETVDAISTELTFQIGANAGQSMSIQLKDMRAAALSISGAAGEDVTSSDGKVTASYTESNTSAPSSGVTDGTNNVVKEYALDISTHEKATAAIQIFNDAIEKVSAFRSELGANQNRLEHTISNLGNASENLTAAESRIRDANMAKEVMEMTRTNILSQASQAMLAQANQAPQSVLQLLG